MRVSKPLILGALGAFTVGVAYDIASNSRIIEGDGHDHTPPRVPFSVALGTAAPATTTTVTVAATYYANMTTGEEYRMPPRDHHEYVGYFTPPADKYIYLVGMTPRRGT
jgi:hypothetical protein